MRSTTEAQLPNPFKISRSILSQLFFLEMVLNHAEAYFRLCSLQFPDLGLWFAEEGHWPHTDVFFPFLNELFDYMKRSSARVKFTDVLKFQEVRLRITAELLSTTKAEINEIIVPRPKFTILERSWGDELRLLTSYERARKNWERASTVKNDWSTIDRDHFDPGIRNECGKTGLRKLPFSYPEMGVSTVQHMFNIIEHNWIITEAQLRLQSIWEEKNCNGRTTIS